MWVNFALFVGLNIVAFFVFQKSEPANWYYLLLFAIGISIVIAWVLTVVTSSEARMWKLCMAAIATPFVQYGWVLLL